MTIHRLDHLTIGKIAAGEVVERPASVVKELVENSLDAGAKRVTVELQRGGRELIQVSDDGFGIPANDLETAVERHTTSKLQAFDDLANLTSYGFRGEALASIAAVSYFSVVTRMADRESGASIRVRHGQVRAAEVAAAAPGTVTTVRDLFANVPARAKFLRRDATETSYVQRMVTAAALAMPEVKFTLIADGKTLIQTDGSGELENALVSILGADTTAQMVPIADVAGVRESHSERPEITVSGHIGLPTITRGNRQQMFITVNRRWIEHRSLNFAVEQAYHSLIMAGRFPIVVLNISVPPERLDVNIHPTKREVRFSDERLVFSAVQRAVRETLLIYSAEQPVPQFVHNPLDKATTQRRMALANPERVNALGNGSLAGHPESTARSHPTHLAAENSIDPRDTDLPVEAGVNQETAVPVLRVLGQVGGNYIIAEGPDGMYLIDQHAAHERVLYERLLAQVHSGTIDRQQLLDALIVDLAPDQLATLERCRADLLGLGFEIEDFGAGSVALRAVPSIMRGRNIGASLQRILDELAGGGRGDSIFDSLVISAACHSSIRSGQTLTLPEMRELIVQLERCSTPRACGHGRPTMLMLSQEELARQFERR